MKRITIISTYRNRGTKNIGDRLITQSLVSLIEDNFGDSVSVEVVFRAATWDEVQEVVEGADHIIFACLPIRSELGVRVYPYLREVIASGVSYSILAAGTDLPVKDNVPLGGGIDEESNDLLRELGARASVFSTRGLLTQRFCRQIGIESSEYQGDVAFYAPAKYGSEFVSDTTVRSIVISDPHRPEKYLRSLSVLIEGLKIEFPSASVVVALHGVNDIVRDYCLANDVEINAIHQDPENGLSIYEDCDLHVGYRVHGHVSALKNRIPSYLMEQDGRGADYGLSLSRKVSVPHFLQHFPSPDGEKLPLDASISAPQQILGMISQDVIDGFLRFQGFEIELEAISRRAEKTVRAIVHSL
ncbi:MULTISPECIES: polysaccharide pyruvyl transferase family protein [unclassified Arthrobacter]|uniref:polysaccharide pyruvyl transferase family protein n=1 Tax=unclassified Arthrobacter TaxID=235627 RepID=UPI0027D89A31|nr:MULTISPECIES: polysaccharide pyruvyl transferase family protein [unclassified Arthrobacter]